ncbi:MAG TPA: dTDP-glucose 4,6-dehydratase [Pyrinomonadaceae bacterium]|nr:dTDP-glucose 4,6-dehydratase [Pyrinomonadaceae bacterium]
MAAASKKFIFVTGGAGFIGSAFIRIALEATDFDIVNFDALTYAGNLENLKEVDSDRHRFVLGNICDRGAVLRALPENTVAIFNFAAESHVDRSIVSAQPFLETNIVGTQVLLDCAKERGVGRFIQVSTDEVMGTLDENPQNFFNEDSSLKPNSPYAASKAAAELFVRAAGETFGIDYVITRCGNNYGPRQFPEKLIPLMISNAINDEPLPVYGDGLNVRDWIYVDDHCRAILAAFEKGKSKSIYNIGARNQKNNLEVVHTILNLLGKPESLIRFVKDRPGHDRRYAIDPTKAEKELDWRPQVDWETGLKQTIEWYLNNKQWVDHVKSGEYKDYYEKMYAERLLTSQIA